IGGHTDNKGKKVFNQKLSEKRANSVKDYLVKRGVPGDQMTAKGYGFEQPIDTNKTDEGRENNRRVEMKGLWGGGAKAAEPAPAEQPAAPPAEQPAAPPADQPPAQ